MLNFDSYLIGSNESIREGFKKQDLNRNKFVLVRDDRQKVIGIVTDGDLRRALWDSISLEDPITRIVNKEFTYFSSTYTEQEASRIFESTKVRHIPILEDGELIDILFKDNFHATTAPSAFVIPVVVMAGGLGTRLDPLTKILPKPLVPIGEKPVIEIIIEKFTEVGASRFFISLHHKAKMIKAFFEEYGGQHSISFLEEESPLGTIGALSLLPQDISTPFLVTNCDVIIDVDYREIQEFHRGGGYEMTIVACMKHLVLPYGVCSLEGQAELASMEEKPKFDFLVNSGMYVFNANVVKLIPEGERFDVPDLITALKLKNCRIGVFPVSEESWIDIGQLEEYKKTLQRLV